MVKILIVEDELIIAEDVRNMLSSIGYEVIDVAMDFDDAVAILEKQKPDLILLDVNLNSHKDGIDLAELINEKHKIPFIFTTSYSDSATINRAKNTNPVNYLVKPFKKEQLYSTIEMSLHAVSNSEHPTPTENDAFVIKDALFLKDKFKYTKLNISDILWIKSDGNYLEIQTTKKEELIRASLSNFIDRLNSDMFFRTHKSYIVNLDYLTKIETNYVTIVASKIPISKNYYDDLLKKLNVV